MVPEYILCDIEVSNYKYNKKYEFRSNAYIFNSKNRCSIMKRIKVFVDAMNVLLFLVNE